MSRKYDGWFALCLLVLVVAIGLYIGGLGVRESNYTLLMASYVLGAAGLTGSWLLSAALLDDEWYKQKAAIAGVVLTAVALVWMSANYPYNWDNATTGFESAIGGILFGLGQAGLAGTVARKMAEAESNNGTWELIGKIGFALGGLVGAVALGLYTYDQSLAAGDLLVRRTAGTAGGIAGGLILFGIANLSPSENRISQVMSVLMFGGTLSAPLIFFIRYPVSIHTNVASSVDTYFNLLLLSIGLGAFAGSFGLIVSRASQSDGGGEVTVVDRFVGLIYLEEQQRLRTPGRMLLGIAVWIFFNIPFAVLIVIPIWTYLSTVTGIPFDLQENIVEVSVLEYTARGLLWFVVYTGVALVSFKYIDKRNPRKVFLSRDDFDIRPRSLGYGLLIGSGAALAVVGANIALGWLELSLRAGAFAPVELVKVGVALLFAGGFAVGNVAFYGMWFAQNAAEGLHKYIGTGPGAFVGLVISALIYNLTSPFVTQAQFTPLNILIWGFFFITILYTAVYSGRSLIAIGIWWGWSALLNVIFGIRFVRVYSSAPFEANFVGPAIYTGGDLGPASGMLGLLIIISTVVLAYDVSLPSRESVIEVVLSADYNSEEVDD